jgi:hypothetical protein
MSEHREEPIDPEEAYPAQGLRRVDRVARLARTILPGARVERTRDVYQLIDEGQGGLVAVVTPEAVEIRLPTVEWTSCYALPQEAYRSGAAAGCGQQRQRVSEIPLLRALAVRFDMATELRKRMREKRSLAAISPRR